MTRLVRDRYLPCSSYQFWDLATGEVVGIDDAEAGGDADCASLQGIREVLDHGQEGRPRSLSVQAAPFEDAGVTLRRAAREGCARGYVTMTAEMYLQWRSVLEEEIRDRSVLLLVREDSREEDVRAAWLDLASRSPRPHVLLTVTGEARVGFARETSAAYGVPAVGRRAAPADPSVVQHLQRATRARTFVQQGRHAAAERLLRDVVAALLRRDQAAHAAPLQIELGRLLLERGRAADAAVVFDLAATAAVGIENGSPPAALLIDARLWQASAKTDAGRLTEAESIAHAVLAMLIGDAVRRARARATLARVLLWQGRAPEAAALDLSGDDTAETIDDHAFAVGVRVRVLLAVDRIFDAGQLARDLLRAAANGGALAQVIAMTAHLRVLVAAGDLTLAAARVADIASLCHDARMPLRVARARLILADGFRRAGRVADARLLLTRLQRLGSAAPLLLRHAVADSLALPPVRTPSPSISPHGTSVSAAHLVTLSQDDEDDERAVRRIIEQVSRTLGCCRMELCSADAGVPSVSMGLGSGLPTGLGGRVVDAGVAVGPELRGDGHELGVPLRRGLRLFAALVARWPADRRVPDHARDLMETTAAIVGPRVEAMQSLSRVTAAAATSVPELVGVSGGIAEVRAAIARAAATPFPVMIEGESGVGKELVARAIHQLSPRRERRFGDVNCAALPDDLLESELFGHARGAFTGAVADRPGLFEDADGGTIFLDELADLSARAQAKLLRVLQQHEVRRVGETFTRKVDVRPVTAANRDMTAEVAAGRFRQDLLYRLDVIRIRIPPLRERAADVPILAQHFWRGAASRVGTTAALTHGVLSALARYHWPGNVRELQNVMAALAVSAPSRGYVRAHLLPAVIARAATIRSARLAEARAEFEQRAVESALARAGGSRTRAARELGLSRQGLLKMMGRLGMTIAAAPEPDATSSGERRRRRGPAHESDDAASRLA